MAVAETPIVLFSHKGWGSVLAEAMLELAGIPYRIEPVDMTKADAGMEKLRAANPLAQIPTLVLPDGTVMAESAAIALYLNDLAPGAGLVPPVGDPNRPIFLRSLVHLVAAVYPTFTYGDFPSRWVDDGPAAKLLRASTDRHREWLWRQIESQVRPDPWFLGQRFSALDIYIGAMTRWRPRREWFAEHCPKLHGIALRADGIDKLKPIWQRNFEG
jgi:GST-like protein